MYKMCGKADEYTVYICKIITMYMQEFTRICRIFICVFIAYTRREAHILFVKPYHRKEMYHGKAS